MLLILLIAIVSVIYFASMQGITCCNSGSSFALVKSLAKKSLTINEFAGYAKNMDYAKINGKIYTDRPPGLAFISLPVYLLKLNVTLVPAIAGIISVVLVYLLTFHLVGSSVIAFFTGFIFAFCTLNWRYSTIYLSHTTSTMLILLSVYGLVSGWHPFFIALLLGISTTFEYTNFSFLIGIIISQIIFGNYLAIPFLFAGYLVGVIPLLVYNKKCFGSPFTTSYKYSAYFKWSNSPKTTFVTPIFKGIFGLLFFIPKKKRIGMPGGVLTLSPVLIFGIIGYFFLPVYYLVLFLLLVLPNFLIISKHKTWWGGGASDYRYISSIIPYLTIPMGLSIKYLPFLIPTIIFLSIVSSMLIISRLIILTLSPDDLKKIHPLILVKVKKRKIGLLELIKPAYAFRLTSLVFEGLFIRKIHLENKPVSSKKDY